MVGTGEGPDFKLEEENKIVQSWVPSVPTGPDWIQACANDEALSTLRNKVFEDIGIKEPSHMPVREERSLDPEIEKLLEIESICAHQNQGMSSHWMARS